jgi:hypothetical protein
MQYCEKAEIKNETSRMFNKPLKQSYCGYEPSGSIKCREFLE